MPLAGRAPGAGDSQFEPLGTARSILIVVYFGVALWYFAWRPSTFNPQAMAFSALLYAAELFGFALALLHIFMTWRLTVRKPPTTPAGWKVDVFVTTYNEPESMLRRTLQAAIRMDYPHDVWLLDDGNRQPMRELAAELGCRYLAREKNTNAKAGNLNNGLLHSKAEFIAVLDADHAPARDFLSRTMGYFRDPRVGFVQTPQDFYNIDSYQHRRKPRRRLVWSEQSAFFRIIQRGKDYWNAAFFCGSCAVLRRRALDDVKGFATGTVTEDLQTSIRIHRKGYKSIYHCESLAFGVAPATALPFLRQRVRWGFGAMHALRGGGILFGSGLSIAQRLCYLASGITYFDGWVKAFFYLAPVIVLTTGVMPIAEVSWAFLAHFVPFYVLTFWAFEEGARGFGRAVRIEQYNMARFAAYAWATTGLVRRNPRFRVTPKQPDPAGESRRLLLPQGLVLLLNVVAIPVGVAVTWGQGVLPTGALVANVAWAALNTSLARTVLGFTARLASFRRREYRFQVPLPARLAFAGSAPLNGVLDDLSSQGFKFYGRFPETVAPGLRLSGELYLPTGPLSIRAEVRALIRADNAHQHVKAIGCRLRWARESDRDQIDGFLFGSDLQWRLNGLEERSLTPTEWIAQRLGMRRRPTQDRSELWACAVLRPPPTMQGSAPMGLISVPVEPGSVRTLITFERLVAGEPLRVAVVTRTGEHMLHGWPEFVDTLESSRGSLFRYSFRARKETGNA